VIPELRTAIVTIGKTITGLSNRFYWLEAPRDTEYPYAVLSTYGNPQSRDTATKFEEVYINISYYDKSAAGVETIAASGRSKFDDSESSFLLIENKVDRIERLNSRDGKIDKVFMISDQYKIELTKGNSEIYLFTADDNFFVTSADEYILV